MDDLPFASAVEQVLRAWAHMAEHGEMSVQTLDKFGLLLNRFRRYATARGARQVGDITPLLASGFIDAQGRTRHGRVSEAALATRHLRRSVLRICFRTARELAICVSDPTQDLNLPRRVRSGVRPLSEDEAVAVRHAAEFVERPTRHAAVAALALSGGHSGEIGHSVLADLDPERRRVWMHGSSKTAARWCPLDHWELRVLQTRGDLVRAQAPACEDPGGLKLAVSSRAGSDEQLQARVCVALTDLLHRIGLAADPAVRPASATAYAGWALFSRTGRIEDAALLLGLGSLDRTAAIIGHDWATVSQEEEKEN